MRWLVLALLACFASTGAPAPVSFAWDADPGYPADVTYELQANECSLTGIAAQTATCDLAGSPGSPLHAQVRAVAVGYEASPWAVLDTVIPGVLLYTPPAPQTGLVVSRSGSVMADPAFAELGTLDFRGNNNASSLSSTIANVTTGDIVVVVVARDHASLISSVSATGFGTFALLATSDANTAGGFQNRIYAGIATADASSRVVTASFSGSYPWGSMFTARYTPGSGLVSLTPLDTGRNPSSGSGLVASSTDRGSAANDVTVASGKRALLIAAGTDWDFYRNHTAQNGYTKRADSDTFGNDAMTQWLYDRVVDAGTYGGTGSTERFGTVNSADQYMGALVALEIAAGAVAFNPALIPQTRYVMRH